jgi:hypothetical protein
VPLQYQIDTNQSLVYLTADDPLTFADWQAVISAVLANPCFKRGFGVISDRRQVLTDKSMEDLPKMAHGWAVVASELVDGSTEIEPAVFTDLDAAVAWVTAA